MATKVMPKSISWGFNMPFTSADFLGLSFKVMLELFLREAVDLLSGETSIFAILSGLSFRVLGPKK